MHIYLHSTVGAIDDCRAARAALIIQRTVKNSPTMGQNAISNQNTPPSFGILLQFVEEPLPNIRPLCDFLEYFGRMMSLKVNADASGGFSELLVESGPCPCEEDSVA